ncbi:GDP-L-fucose synthase [Hydrogenovibrio sp. JE_KL2]|uniref:GDP-L-fucose synthase family protein n=1 Tax=Hydrogenovibrio sp. JE_KL2 TaxID=2651188 RepID=UPI00128CA3B2|nr:GDP-L-fucose synthase [Hydrogenovibrio sp. JE_KL2]MPQ75457.1 GDP-L-fucose synthase [Hydrogenovibrio sp. JE_KL2]
MEASSKIFVAGHKGLIGSAIVENLRLRGFNNIVTVDRSQLDLTDKKMVDQFFDQQKPEYVILAAGKVGGIVENKTYPADFMNVNLAIQLNCLQAANRNDVKKLIFFASSCMYPKVCPQPMSEQALFSGYPEPTSMAYAVSKMAGMQMCLSYNVQYNCSKFIPIIPNSVYGPNDNFNPESGHVMSALIRRFHEAKAKRIPHVELWGTGTPRREFIHSDDVAKFCLHVLETEELAIDLPINIGTGTDYSIAELAKEIASVIGYSGDIRWDASKPDGAPRKLLNSSRAFSMGWRPEITLETGLYSTYQWYLENIAD